MMAYNYDLLVIGAGSAGLAAAKRSATYGVKVALVEQEQLGGVCTNQGCIPKKLMVYASDFSRWLDDARHYGWTVENQQFNWRRFVAARDAEIDRIHQVQQKALSDAGVDLLHGHAAFLDQHTVAVDPGKVTADKILIAVGGKPNKPNIPGIEHTMTSREMFHLQELPSRLAILGGGYIGVEFASILHGFGVDVILINQAQYLLTGFDQSLQTAVQDGLLKRGIQVHCNTTAAEIKPTRQGLQLTLSGDHPQTLTVDTVLCATGRSANLAALNLDKAGVAIDDKAIPVDAYSRTNQENIFAVGDCTDRLALTPAARSEGRAFADTVFGNQPDKLDYGSIPSAVFVRPEAATVGMTEAQAREQYGDDQIECNSIEFIPLFNRLSHSSQPALFKQVIHRKSDRILGIHLVCEHAAEMIQGMALAVKQSMTKQEIDHTIGIHPTSAEEFFG